jgi:hypothetical protein
VLELPKPPWYRRVGTLYLAVAVVVTVVLVAATVAFGSRGEPAASQATVTSAAPVTTEGNGPDPTPTPTGTTPPSRTSARTPLGVLWQKSGSDVHHGRQFEAPGRWRLDWSFDCRSFARYGGGNFKITGEGDLDGVSVQEFAVKGTGSRPVVGGGRGRLVVESVCDRWTVKAVAT